MKLALAQIRRVRTAHRVYSGAFRCAMRTLLFVCAFVLVAVAIRLYPKPPISSNYTSSTAVYDAKGQLLRLTLAKDDRYRLWLPLKDISPEIIEAFQLQEDRLFY